MTVVADVLEVMYGWLCSKEILKTVRFSSINSQRFQDETPTNPAPKSLQRQITPEIPLCIYNRSSYFDDTSNDNLLTTLANL